MNYLALSSSTACLNANSSFLTLAHSSSAQPFCPMNQRLSPLEFQTVTKSPGYILGEQLANLRFVKMASNVASYVYSKLPSFSLPVAAASPAPCALSICPTPAGSYETSCQKPVVKYLPEEDRCELTTRCATIYEGLPHQQTSIRFSPRDSELILENKNGTLVVQYSREETVNARLCELSTIAATPEALKKEQAAIIGTLNAGDVITLSRDLEPSVISPEKWPKDNKAFSAFQRIAKATGGIMGHSLSATSLNPLIEKISAHILKAAESSEFIDIAFVLDTTGSMDPYIAQVRNNLVQLLEKLQEKANTCRVAIVEYRDVGALFLNKVNTGFTSNLNQVQRAVRDIGTAGGGDLPEAVLDALLVAKNELSWHPKAKRVVILIGDAPPQPKTIDGLHDEAAVIAQYQSTSTEITVYPIFAEKWGW